MEMNELRYFLAVAQTENVHRASENINISKGSLSKAISRLEDELRVNLFVRDGRGIKLTQEGIFLKSRASEVLNLESEIKLDILGQETEFKAKIGGNEVLLSYYGVEISSEINGLYKNSKIDLSIQSDSDLLTKIKDGELHLGLSTNLPTSEFRYKQIASVKFHTVLAKPHPLFSKAKKNIEISMNEVLQYDFVVPKLNILGRIGRDQSADGWRDDKFKRKKTYITSSLKTIQSFVESGKALAYLPDYLILNPGFEILNILECPYQCNQKIYLIAKKKQAPGWVNQLF